MRERDDQATIKLDQPATWLVYAGNKILPDLQTPMHEEGILKVHERAQTLRKMGFAGNFQDALLVALAEWRIEEIRAEIKHAERKTKTKQ